MRILHQTSSQRGCPGHAVAARACSTACPRPRTADLAEHLVSDSCQITPTHADLHRPHRVTGTACFRNPDHPQTALTTLEQNCHAGGRGGLADGIFPWFDPRCAHRDLRALAETAWTVRQTRRQGACKSRWCWTGAGPGFVPNCGERPREHRRSCNRCHHRRQAERQPSGKGQVRAMATTPVIAPVLSSEIVSRRAENTPTPN